MSMQQKWDDFREHLRIQNALGGARGVLSWDQKTYMPPQGNGYRGQQISVLAALMHDRTVDTKWGDLLQELSTDVTADAIHKSAVQHALREHQKAKCIPRELVEAFSQATSEAAPLWVKAKEQNDFSIFAPILGKVIELSRQKAKCLGSEEKLYDNLLDQYDPGVTVNDLDAMFSRLKSALVPIIAEQSKYKQAEKISAQFSNEELNQINLQVITALGFDTERGRLDHSEHPFSLGIGPNDVRLTTHNHAHDILGTLSGTIHECGHGMYEQGMPSNVRSLGLCDSPGCGIHESQSRFYENMIGHSLEFFNWLSPVIEQHSKISLSPEQLYCAANRVVPSFIRIYADESTYNLHIIIRYELEKALIKGEIAVADVAELWADAYEENLGIRPQNYSQGVLQDIHWSLGFFGYFPSYTIGNLYSASYKAVMQEQLPNMWKDVSNGNFSDILKWVQTHIHQQGRRQTQEEIVAAAVGQRDHVQDLIEHFQQRHGLVNQLLRT